MWLRFLNKSSCIFTKRRYLMLEEIGVIRSTINGCVSLYLCDCWKSHLGEIRFQLPQEKRNCRTLSESYPSFNPRNLMYIGSFKVFSFVFVHSFIIGRCLLDCMMTRKLILNYIITPQWSLLLIIG